MEGHIDEVIGAVAMVTARDDDPFRLGLLTDNMFVNGDLKSTLSHKNFTFLGQSPSQIAAAVSEYYEDPEVFDLITARFVQGKLDKSDLPWSLEDGKLIMHDKRKRIVYSVYGTWFFYPGFILAFIFVLALLVVVFIGLYASRCRK